MVDTIVLREDANDSRRRAVRGGFAVSAISHVYRVISGCAMVHILERLGDDGLISWRAGMLSMWNYGIYIIYLWRWTLSPVTFVIVVCIHE
jgi:hypothetical protein